MVPIKKFIYCVRPDHWESRQKKYFFTLRLGSINEEPSFIEDGYDYDYASEEEIFERFMRILGFQCQQYFDVLDNNGVFYDVAIVRTDIVAMVGYMVALCLDVHGATLIKVGTDNVI